MDPVERDVRALISTFHHYATHVARVVESVAAACGLVGDATLTAEEGNKPPDDRQ